MNNYQLITNYYIAHRDELLAYASNRLGYNSMEAEDIVQNTFLRLLTTDKMITAVTLPALVYTIEQNLINDYYRRHYSFEQYEHYIKNVCSEQISQESVLSSKEIIKQLEQGLAKVSTQNQHIYRLHIYDGMKIGEISKELGVTYKAVEHRLERTRKLVRDRLMAAGF